MFKYWGAAEVTSLLCKRFWNNRTEIADKIGKFDIDPIENREIKTVAFYYYCYSIGGVERVLSLVMPMFVKMGYKVILVTDKPPHENDFALPDGVERCVLFDKDEVTADNFMLTYIIFGVIPFNIFRYILVVIVTFVLYKKTHIVLKRLAK
jgi:hypothetical protein